MTLDPIDLLGLLAVFRGGEAAALSTVPPVAGDALRAVGARETRRGKIGPLEEWMEGDGAPAAAAAAAVTLTKAA